MLSSEEKQAVIDLYPFMGDRPMVFDCGSNKGHWADVILDEFKSNCEIHLFEPNKKLLSFTEIKYEYVPEVRFHNMGLLNENGASDFFFFDNFNNELSSFYQGGDEWNWLPMKKEQAEVRKGDLVCQQLSIKRVDFLKIDCEGSDMQALLGFEQMFAEDKVGIVQIEYSAHWSRAGNSYKNLNDLASKYGYKIYRYYLGNFWEVKEAEPQHDNYYVTKFEIHDYSIAGSNNNFILNTVGLPKMDLILEVGAMEGFTTKYMCESLLNKDNPNARVIVVDPLYDYYVTDDPRYHPEFKHQYYRFKRNTRGLPVDLKRGESEHELPKLNALRFDFIYVDGNHYPDWPYHDLVWAFTITKIGGYILADDYDLWAEGTKESIDKFLNEFKDHYDVVARNYQILIQKKQDFYNELTEDYYK